MRDHDPLGQAGRAGRVTQHGDIVGIGLPDVALEGARVPGFVFPALPHHVAEAHQEGIVVMAQPQRVPVNQLLEQGQLGLYLQDLVHLLLIPGHDELGIGMLGNVSDFGWNGIGENAQGDSAGGLGGNLCPVPFRVIVAKDGYLVGRFQPHAHQPQGEVFDLLIALLPRVTLPYAKLLLAHGQLLAAIVAVVFQEQPGQGIPGRRWSRGSCFWSV